AQFNLVNTLNRFVPSAGRATHRLILYAYGVSLTLGVILSMIFVFGIDTWAPALRFLKQDPTFTLLFILSVELWCVFALQDSILIGTRQATWVLIENSIFSVAKLALLVYFASVIADYGVWASWVVPIAGGVVFINMLLFSRIIPQHVRATQDR